MVRPQRWVGDVNALLLHDREEPTPCDVEVEYRRYYDSISEAKRQVPYSNCPVCLDSEARSA